MTRTVSWLAFLVLLAPSTAHAQWLLEAHPDVLYYTFPDSPPRPMITPGLPAPCEGSNRAFAHEAENLIATGVDANRTSFAPAAPPLMPDPDLTRIAQIRSCEMAQGLTPFSHFDAGGHFIAGEMVRARFGPAGMTGENIMETDGTRSFGAREFAGAAVESWMKSPDHRANILNPAFDSAGVGVAKVEGKAVATQVFHGQTATGKAGQIDPAD